MTWGVTRTLWTLKPHIATLWSWYNLTLTNFLMSTLSFMVTFLVSFMSMSFTTGLELLTMIPCNLIAYRFIGMILRSRQLAMGHKGLWGYVQKQQTSGKYPHIILNGSLSCFGKQMVLLDLSIQQMFSIVATSSQHFLQGNHFWMVKAHQAVLITLKTGMPTTYPDKFLDWHYLFA